MSKNYIAIIWTPHFNTNCLRASVSKQRHPEHNYIVVACSPQYNGIYRWDKKDLDKVSIWDNNGNNCYCVPLEICTKTQELESIKSEELRKEIIAEQKRYCKKYRTKDAKWILKEKKDEADEH